jgi:single-strand DNA-binding protein
MAGHLNKVCIIGNLGKDPEVRSMTSGAKLVNLSVATSESWKDKATGEKKEVTEWHRVVIFNENLAKIAEQYLHKGDKVYLEGALKTRKWTDKDGHEKYTTEIVMSGFNGTILMLSTAGGNNGGDRGGQGQTRSAPAAAPASFQRDEMDDEIPF